MATPRISFEFFPPQSLEASFRLWDTVQVLAPLNPNFVSVTYGAGGTTRDLTHDAVTTIQNNYGLKVAAHLTCINSTRDEILAIADKYAKAGVTDIVALRGDAPKGADGFKPVEGGFTSSIELVETLAETGKFNIRVGAYPEPHPESPDTAADVDWLKRKIDAGASSAITQFFFEAETFFRFRDACEKAGIDAPIIPGIMPITSWTGIKKFAAGCGASIPTWLDDAFTKAIRDGR
ncbi:MAG TPA: 5,10-methylenetetrahydrofolate reductase, partial [Rhodobacteraceae bacterium]|nr:5,10-methylenetetrahydrofolate reductase [Paracoccaceae bacterium]